MNMTKMNKVMKNVVFPLMVGGILWSSEARANAAGDITSIKSDQANGTYTASGTFIDFKMSLAGYFKLDNSFGGTVALPPEIRMVVNGDVAYAQLYSLSQNTIAAGTVQRTDAIFRYTVKPGDMAQPLKIFGSTSVAYQFNWNSWQIISVTNSAVQPVWKFNTALSLYPNEGEVFDLDLAKANITIKTLSFDEVHSPVSIAATENNTWRVDTVNPIGSAVVDFYVWTTGTNLLQLGTVPNQTALLVSMPTGASFVDFPIRGLAVGTTDIYLQRTKDYQNNATLGVTNSIKRSITITTPPAPTIKVTMLDTGSDNVTMAETAALNTGSFQVELSEAYSNDIRLGIATQPVGQSNVTFSSTPYLVTVPAGSLISSVAKFSAADGTILSSTAGVILTPYITNNAPASAYFTRIKSGTVYVTDVAPTVTPAPVSPTATMNTPFTFTWTTSDVAADLATGMTVTWDFADGTVTNVPGSSGSISHTFAGAANSYTKTVTVTAHDKDGLASVPVSLNVTVVLPLPQPYVSVVVTPKRYDETNDLGSLTVYLSEGSFPGGGNVFVKLNTDPANQGNIRFATNIVKISYGSTNSEPQDITILDGTIASASSGITIIPALVNNASASAYFTDLRETTMFVKNDRPTVTLPVARDLSLQPQPQYTNIAMGRPFTFAYTVKDVAADASSMVVTWTFGDGISLVVTGAVGSVSHTYASKGTMFLSVQAMDKDGGQSDLVEFPVQVVSPPPPPTVRILSPASALFETIAPNTGSFIVQLSEAFTNVVTVDLTTLPANSLAAGTIALSTNRVVFLVGETEKTVRFSARDGTDQSYAGGFTIVPSVFSSAAAKNYFLDFSPGTVEIINVNPVIQSPSPSLLTSAPMQVAQGSLTTFTWQISDVPQDLLDLASTTPPNTPAYAMQVVWYFGDGTTGIGYGGSGSITHTYTSVSDDINVRVVATDKDGGQDTVTFKITVLPSKIVFVTPIGPSGQGYYGSYFNDTLKPLGAGTIGSLYPAVPVVTNGTGYIFTYPPATLSATIQAIPYRTQGYDSFFFVWQADANVMAAKYLNPSSAATPLTNGPAYATVLMKDSATNAVILDVTAVFSREKLQTDNVGDINQDYIPDNVAFDIETKIGAQTQGSTTQTGTLPVGVRDLQTYNDDLDKLGGTVVGDFLPMNPAKFDFRPVGKPFIAKYEVRGFDEHLNAAVSDKVAPLDEPYTDPTLADTDGDGYLDGWEYYFWHEALFATPTMQGSRFNPSDVANGTLILDKTIADAFVPNGTRATSPDVKVRGVDDLDNDGLLDVEEMVLGTNPCNWDTDGDGMCDGWELLRGLNPRDPADGGSSNPDGDYMAYARVNAGDPQHGRYLVTAGGVTYLSNKSISGGTALAVSGASFTTSYHYGDSNAVLAVGCPVVPPAGALASADSVPVDVLFLHFQVLREFGFDPRTAWTPSVNFHNAVKTFDRFPAWLNYTPNTKAFTSLDEYLLIKFMSETRMNGASGTMTSANWAAFSTDPLTPDSDVDIPVKGKNDGMPDGWELYVSVDPTLDLTNPLNRQMGISPWDDTDGDADSEPAVIINGIVPIAAQDGLINRREFGGTDSSVYYNDSTLYNSVAQSNKFLHVVSITQPAADKAWLNKFWPTNPWSHDTDGDGMNDLAEATFIYGAAVDNHSPCIPGGGLNPDSMDTDLDALPDAWEFEFRGGYNGSVITNGMDGTLGTDFNKDWDSDGLLNYQEYWTQAMRSFRYDITDAGTVSIFGKPGQPMDDTFAPSSLFTEVSNTWDQARFPWGNAGPVLYVQLPLINMYDIVNKPFLYASTDPRNYDSDGDGMDDYYELFHGLNPLLGDPGNDDNIFVESADLVARASLINGGALIDYNINEWGGTATNPLLLDFVKYPWMTGLPEADPDADGLRNSEEQLQPNTPAPFYSHTDPTPMWMTDESNTNSYTARFYHPMGYADFAAKVYSDTSSMFYWPPLPIVPPDSVYTYERNEGYDTDNDGISDKSEMVNSKNRLSDPLDSDDPIRRQAMWFSGTNSAATMTKAFTLGVWTLRSFTVELWARPEVVNREQVLAERVFAYAPSDLSTTNKVVRRNFRIGIAADGRVYGGFDNAGARDDHTASVVAYGKVLKTNEWVHIAVRMDGAASAFSILVNGMVYETIGTTLVPANGVLIVESDPFNPLADPNYTIIAGGLVVGAANDHPGKLTDQVWSDYSRFFKGSIDEVRIWDGARSNDEIFSNYKKRFAHGDLLNNRLLVQTEIAKGFTRVVGNPQQLAPELLYNYNFDNIFGADVTNNVATSPRGFESGAVTINQPADAAIRWWADAAVKSTVYTDYKYLPMIENTVAHLPIFGSATSVGAVVTVLMTNTVADSVYWTHTAAGNTPGSFNFPNSNNPYDIASDLLPLGDAFAKQLPTMWDDLGASGSWLETATDSDFDGLPDWWENYMSGTDTGIGWDEVDPATGLTYGEEYQRAVADGATKTDPTGASGLKQTADSDGDGMPDWWENLYNLNAASDQGDNGAMGDPDRDGLSNLAEYMISEVYGFRHLSPNKFKTDANQAVSDYFLKQGSLTLGAMFTDHDFMEDTWEDQFDPYYVSRYVYDPFGDADEDGWSNWAECRYSADHVQVRADQAMVSDPLGNMIYSFPVPTIQTTLRYDGARSSISGSTIIQVYSKPDMNGLADATYTLANDPNAVATKTQPLGYWSDRTVSDTLSPGSVQPGSVGLKFTDLWTGLALTTGFDSQGVLYYGTIGGVSGPIGTIDYITGKFTLDLDHYKNNRIVPSANPGAATNRAQYVDCNVSYIEMSYKVRAISTWPKTLYLGRADIGYVREGTNYVFAFVDLDGNGTWNAGEPCGVSTPIATDMGWDYNTMNIQLTDYTPGYLRMSLPSGVRSEEVFAGGGVGGAAAGGTALETHVRVRRSLVDGYLSYQRIVLDKVIDSSRSFLHEGDLFAQGELGLDWGLTDVPTSMNREIVVYDVYLGDATILTNNAHVATFTNKFDVGSDRAQAKATSPISGKYVYSARPAFKWSMPDGYTAFALEIRKGSSTGPVVYQSGELQVPTRDVVTGEYMWEAPIHAGDKLPNGQVFASNTMYAWRVIALNSKFTLLTTPITWSAWNVFRLDVNAPPSSSGYGELRVQVKYNGPAIKYLSGRVKVQAYRNRGFVGVPDQQYTLSDAELGLLTNAAASGTNAVMRGLTPSSTAGNYYVRAFIDQNMNGVRDVWESWGYGNYYGLTDTPYSARPIEVKVSTSSDIATVIIEDADSDQDWFPDAWEFDQNPTAANFLELTGPSAAWLNTVGDTEVNPKLLTSGPFSSMSFISLMAMGTTDQDGDGVGDLAELILGTNPNAASTAHDGYTDAEKMGLGLSGSDSLAFGMTAISKAGNGETDLTWKLDVTKAAAVSRTFLSAVTGVASDGDVSYSIEYTPSLLNANWQSVQTGSVKLNGTQTFQQVIDEKGVIDPAKGFFRVRLIK